MNWGKIKMNVYYLIAVALVIAVLYTIAFFYLIRKNKESKLTGPMTAVACVFLLWIRREFLVGNYNFIASVYTVLMIFLFVFVLWIKFRKK